MRKRYLALLAMAGTAVVLVGVVAIVARPRPEEAAAVAPTPHASPAKAVAPAQQKPAFESPPRQTGAPPQASPEVERGTALNETAVALLDSARKAKREKLMRAVLGLPDAEAAKLYEEYLALYPNDPGDLEIKSLLAFMYSRLGRHEESIALLKAAIAQGGKDPFVHILENNLADAEMRSGDLDGAEARLERLIALPVSAKTITEEPRAAIVPLFVAPFAQAKICEERRDVERADEIYAETEQRAIDLARRYPKVDWIPSYAAGACLNRVRLLQETRPNDPEALDRAQELYNDARQNFPNADTSTAIILGNIDGAIQRWRGQQEDAESTASP